MNNTVLQLHATMVVLGSAQCDAILGEHALWLHSEGREGRRANLREMDLRGCNLAGKVLRQMSFRGSNLQGMDLRGIDASEADFASANLSDVQADNADFTRALLMQAQCRQLQAPNADFTECNLTSTDCTDAVLSGAILRRANLREALLCNATLNHASLNGVVMRSINLEDANLESANLTGADIRDGILRRTLLKGATLSGVQLRGAVLEDLAFSEIDFTGVEDMDAHTQTRFFEHRIQDLDKRVQEVQQQKYQLNDIRATLQSGRKKSQQEHAALVATLRHLHRVSKGITVLWLLVLGAITGGIVWALQDIPLRELDPTILAIVGGVGACLFGVALLSVSVSTKITRELNRLPSPPDEQSTFV